MIWSLELATNSVAPLHPRKRDTRARVCSDIQSSEMSEICFHYSCSDRRISATRIDQIYQHVHKVSKYGFQMSLKSNCFSTFRDLLARVSRARHIDAF